MDFKRTHKGIIWISWEVHRRTKELCRSFNIPLFIFKSNLPRLFKHPLLMLKTLLLILKRRPAILIVQNPSVFLTIEVCLFRNLFKYKLVVDAHNEGVQPFICSKRWLLAIYRFIHRTADLTVVTNAGLGDIISNNGGRPFILPDRLPTPQCSDTVVLSDKFNVVLISTFAPDEPYDLVIRAASFFEKSVTFYVTGDHKKANSSIMNSLPNNVKFLGYIPDESYWDLLKKANAVIDLTEMEDCLVCGAYEAVAAETPLITSDTSILRMYFNKGVVYTAHNIKSICSAITEVIKTESQLKQDICLLKQELAKSWKHLGNNFVSEIIEMMDS